jgi:hypothetical protein
MSLKTLDTLRAAYSSSLWNVPLCGPTRTHISFIIGLADRRRLFVMKEPGLPCVGAGLWFESERGFI